MTRTRSFSVVFASVILSLLLAFAGTGKAFAAAAYTLRADGYCASASCIQSSVDRSGLSYLDYRKMGVNLQIYAGHNYKSQGATIAKMNVGDVVTVTGNGSAKYKVTKIVWASKRASSSSVPTGVAFQTCVGTRLKLAYVSKVTTAPASHNPSAHMDSVSVNSDRSITVKGWGFDLDAKSSSTSVNVYIDGKGYSVAANASRADVKKAYKLGTDKVGFNWKSPKLKNGKHSIKVAVINKGGGSNQWFWSGTKTVSA